MLRIACLHTAESNIAVFDAASKASGLTGVELRHAVRADLLAAAEASGGLVPEVASQTAAALRALQAQADAVLLTCSTLGPAAETAAKGAPVPVVRVDAALAEEAVEHGGKVVVLCAVETTMEPTRLLFEKAARATGAEVAVRLVPRAWEAFKAGDRDRYLAIIARAADEAVQAGAARVALAQASMAPASSLTRAGQAPLNSPVAGLAAVVAAASRGGCGRPGPMPQYGRP